MTRAPDWTLNEFEVVRDNPEMSSDNLATLLPNRSVGAVDSVRVGIHKHHLGEPENFLSEFMRECLDAHRDENTCPTCKERF